MVDASQFAQIFRTVRNGITEKHDEDVVAEPLAELLLRDKLRRGIVFEELGFAENVYRENGSLNE